MSCISVQSRFLSLAVRLLETDNNDNRFHSFRLTMFREFCSEDIKAIIVSWQENLALSNEQRFRTSKTLLRANEKLLCKVLINTRVHTYTYKLFKSHASSLNHRESNNSLAEIPRSYKRLKINRFSELKSEGTDDQLKVLIHMEIC